MNAKAYADRRLIDRCLAGEEAAWKELFDQRQDALVRASRSLLGPNGGGGELAEEIAARVWFSLLRDGGKVLARFDPTRDRDLGSFLSGVARYEVLQHQRSERRRQSRETITAQKPRQHRPVRGLDVAALLNEFMETLTPAELGFMEEFLLSPPKKRREGRESLSQANVWQRRHRLRVKLLAFLDGA